MGSDTSGLEGAARGDPADPRDGGDDHLISLPGRSPVLDPAQLDVLRRCSREREVATGDVLFADGDETCAAASSPAPPGVNQTSGTPKPVRLPAGADNPAEGARLWPRANG